MDNKREIETGKLNSFLSHLGYSGLLSKQDSFSYFLEIDKSEGIDVNQKIQIDFFYFNQDDELFKKHLEVWNQNNRTSFVAVFDDKTYIIDSRQKPDVDTPLDRRVIIESFQYGANTPGYDLEKLKLITKEGLDSGYYFDFIIEHQKRKKASEVDKDLLLNLLALRNDLGADKNEETIHLLLLRCLFLKYLEDRGVFAKDSLLNALSAQSPEKLIQVFGKVRKINGDLFKNNKLQSDDLKPKYLQKLSQFFGYTDYITKQGRLFPYQFNKIPIQLISNIYESFLKVETKKGDGIYYTPLFLANFMLSHSLSPILNSKKNATTLDPACGSGTFLVEAFRMLIKANKAENKYEKKISILKNQLFGIDIDQRALQIAAFSLYLALLEGEDSAFIQEKIRTESPILPGLLGKNLINGNALTDEITFEVNGNKVNKKFDCIIANPPWGSVTEDGNSESIKTREAISNMELYKAVSDIQRSQAFLLRTEEWADSRTHAVMVVNNSIFLNERAVKFRKELLNKYTIETFYELSNINPILFKKRTIGYIKNFPVEVGANEPCCVLVYKLQDQSNGKLKYITPKLNKFTNFLRIIAYGARDVREVEHDDFNKEDMLWKIFVNGGWSDYQTIKKRVLNKDKSITLECRRGFEAKKNMKSLGEPEWIPLIDLENFKRYRVDPKNLQKFNMSQDLHRKRDKSIFQEQRIILPVRPLTSHELRFSAVILKDYIVHKDNIHSIKIKRDGKYVKDYRPYLAILNSKFVGYYSYLVSSNWGKGDAKRITLRNCDIEEIPFPAFNESDALIKTLSHLVTRMESDKYINELVDIENKIDDIVFKLYNLTQYEREVINEFYDVHHYKKDAYVKENDIKKYVEQFTKVFSLMLSDKVKISPTYDISQNLGAYVSFTVSNQGSPLIREHDLFFELVKKAQVKNSYFSSLLEEEKVKFYDKEKHQFYLIKSNLFRDWTERQAIDDANEEIGDIIKYLKKK